MAFTMPGRHHPQLAEENRRVLTMFQTLTSKIESITSIAADAGEPSIKYRLEEELEALQTCADGIESFLKFQISPEYYNERKSKEESTMASEVCNIPELLENILKHVEVHDVINFCLVNRRARAIVDASPLLQVKLCNQAASREDFEMGQYTSPFVMSLGNRFYPAFSVEIHSDPLFFGMPGMPGTKKFKRRAPTSLAGGRRPRQPFLDPAVTAQFCNYAARTTCQR